jgi:hypothetical protein
LADGTVQLRGHRGANNDPQAGTGTAALVQALKLLQAAASDPGQGLVPCPDCRRHGYLPSSAAAVSPSSMVGESDAATALGLLGPWDWAPRVRSSCCARTGHPRRLPRPTVPAGSRPRVRGNPGPAPRRG